MWRGGVKVNELGLYRVTDGTLSAVTAAGPLNPKEVADMRATDAMLEPDGRGQRRLRCIGWRTACRSIRRVVPAQTASGSNWIGLRRNGAYRVTSLEQQPLLPAWAGAAADGGLAAAGVADRRAIARIGLQAQA